MNINEKAMVPIAWLFVVIGVVLGLYAVRLDALEKRVDERYDILIQIKEDVAVIKKLMERGSK